MVHNELGEGVIWDHTSSRVWWTDIQQSKLYRYDPKSRELEQWDTPERLCCFTPVENKDYLLGAFESGFAFYVPASGLDSTMAKLTAKDDCGPARWLKTTSWQVTKGHFIAYTMI